MIGQPSPIDLLALGFVDLRATVEAMLRAIMKGEGSVEHFRHTRDIEVLSHAADALAQLQRSADSLCKSAVATGKVLSLVTS